MISLSLERIGDHTTVACVLDPLPVCASSKSWVQDVHA
jgi:hypothetical protein